MDNKDEAFKLSLQDKNIPILTLDTNWHRLFTQADPTPEIKEYEALLNNLLKEQGQANNDIKEIKKMKSKLMSGIVSLIDDPENKSQKSNDKEMEQHKKQIEELNSKLEALEDRLLELPREIRECNYQLMLYTMEECYRRIQENTSEIEEIGKWISVIRVELKKKVIRKQEKELWNFDLYSYMHSIFGKDVVDIFDMKYDPSVNPPMVKGNSQKEESPKEPTEDNKHE